MNDEKKKPFAGGRGKAGGGGKPGGGKSGGSRPDGSRPDRSRSDSGEGKKFAARKPFGGPRSDASGRPAAEGGAKKPFQRQDGAKRAFAKRNEDGSFARPRPGKWERAQEGRNEGRGEGEERGAARRFTPRDGDAPRAKPRFGPRSDRPASERPYSDRPRPQGPRPDKRPYQERKHTHRDKGAVDTQAGGERIARRLARAGVASRRDAEEMIAAGRVSLNGKVLETPAVNVGERDHIEIDGKPIPAIERTRLFLFHKPSGVVTTSRDPEGRKTIFDVLPEGLPRLISVGRLDINTEGLLLLTNDGGLSRVLELPATGWLRRYRVRVHGKVEQQALDGLKDGIAVDGVFYGAVEAVLEREQGSNAWLSIGLREGKNREVKNILGALGLEVTRLIRVSFGPFQLGDLPEGELRELKGRYLRDQLGERLIEESGANFDAPVLTQLAPRDEAAEGRPTRQREERPVRQREERPRERHENRRDDALARLDTRKPPRGRPDGKDDARAGGKGRFSGPKPGFAGKPGGREERPLEPPRSRAANVWMAPGAKPMGEKKKAALAERNEGRRYAGKPRPAGKPGGKPGGASRPGGKPSARPGLGRGGPRKPRSED